MRPRNPRYLVAGLLAAHLPVWGQPQRLAEIGPTQPIAVVRAYQSAVASATQSATQPEARPIPISPVAPATPFQSHTLTAGFLREPVRLKTPIARPMAWVGDDALSLTWLARHAPAFAKRAVPVLVVSLAQVESLTQLRRQYPALAITAFDADSLAHTLGVSHYPVLLIHQEAQQ